MAASQDSPLGPRLKVTLAGAHGMIGSAVRKVLCDSGKFDVQVLVRPNAPSIPDDRPKIIQYHDTSDPILDEVLKGQDVLISALGKNALVYQPSLIEAAIRAGVKRIIPSEFGGDLQNSHVRTMPNYQLKVDVEDMLQKHAVATTGVTYTFIYTGCLLDWAVSPSGALLLDPNARHIKLYDGGERKFSTSTIATAAKAVVGVLDNLAATANKAVRVQSTVLTQNQILQLARAHTANDGGKEWTSEVVSTQQLEEEALESLKTGPLPPQLFFNFAVRGIFGSGHGGHFTSNDNELLGLRDVSWDEVNDIVRDAISSST